MKTLIVVEQLKRWPLTLPHCELVEAERYLTHPEFLELRRAKVLNLCRSYRYQSVGYYVSLLAEARGQRPLPSLSTLQDLKNKSIAGALVEELEELIQRTLGNGNGNGSPIQVRTVFGRSLDGKYDTLAQRLFRLFPAPFLQATFSRHPKSGVWGLSSISGFSLTDLAESDYPRVQELLERFLSRPYVAKASRREGSFDLAILHNRSEKEPPSDERALKRFEQAAESVGFAVEYIQKEDYERLPQFDALFIRETTNVCHHTYRFSRRAAAEGLVVIDDPVSILRCTNKVYLAEVLSRHKIATPETMLVNRDNAAQLGQRLGYPFVLKLPDSSFSLGVFRIDSPEKLESVAKDMFARSDLLVGQRFMQTPFDWRVGVFNRKALYACRYFMAYRHWQVIRRDGEGKKLVDGRAETIPVDQAPRHVIDTAVAAANLIGDGLYGVDLKEVDGRALIIEINDNPSIESGLEDAVLGDELYRTIMRGFAERIEALRGVGKRL
jgi:glutathione synthase/RimK-type ligase-like ATP-grasp enzyme